MSTIQEQVGYEHIRLYWPYEAQTLQEVRIIRKMNDHATLYVSGILPEEQGEQCIKGETDREPIAIRQVDKEGREVRRLFHGVLTDLAVHRVNGVYRFELEAISHSSQLDWKPRRRSYQNVDLTYSALLEQILADYLYADVIDMASGTAKLEEFTLQYDETDWAFIKRMAARFGTVVIPEVTAASPKVFFGVPEGRLWEIEEESSYRLKKILGHVRLFDEDRDRGINRGREERADHSWTDGESTYGYTAYIMESHSHYALGDSVILGDGGELKVAAAETRMQDAVLTTTYQLVPEEQLKQRPLANKRITGVTLSGKVLDVKQDEVQLQLTIDEGETPVDARSKCWFSVATAYVADGQSGLYSMPERGDLAQLYIPSVWEGQAYVQGSIPQQTGKMTPGEKVWGTAVGKEVRLGQQELKLSASEGLIISLNDGDILIESSGHVAISGGALQVKAGDKLNVQAGQAIYLRGGSSSMILDGETDIKSPSIQQTGSVKAPVFVADLPPMPEPPLMTIEAYEAAQSAATTTPTITASVAPDQGALLKVGLALLGMVPVIGPMAKVAATSLSLGMLGATPTVGSMKSLALQIYGGFVNHLKEQKAEENYYSSMFWGKVFTSARNLKSPTSLKDLLLQMNQVMKEIETTYYNIPENVRERWIQQEENRKLQKLQDEADAYNQLMCMDTRNGFKKSIDSFGEIGTDIVSAAKDRGDKARDSAGDMLNYLTSGIPKGIYDAAAERTAKRNDSFLNYLDYLTIGLIVSPIKGTINPEGGAYSKEHWLSSFGLASTVVGGIKVPTIMKPSTGVKLPNQKVTRPGKVEGPGKPTNTVNGIPKHSLSDVEARQWYLRQERSIPSLIDSNLQLEKQARQAFDLRNKYRTEARELMSDLEGANELFWKEPNKSWNEIIDIAKKKGYSGDEIYNYILGSSQRSRKSVNQKLGLE
ncbi:contractile injection system protein, VgrG/Pvc8 family [Paenibacillus sp. IHBB 10380]|uniref:contractile injection system protein, VgrG/Pvc8 family n=1 Tax=Paenibacillus sp. IHBB 10380 TaxID=1566358 RepID=UPI0006981BA7|nr:contractile injection system protein, VgrG/Pvc8 family [Paenibacillus sp. IHBB 10380]